MGSIAIKAAKLRVDDTICEFQTDRPMGRVESVTVDANGVTFKDSNMTYAATVPADTVLYVLVCTVMATSVTVWASRREVNVIIPGTGYRGEGNHVYERPKGPIGSWLTDLVRHTIDGETLGWKAGGYEVLSSPSVERGKHAFTVWIPSKR